MPKKTKPTLKPSQAKPTARPFSGGTGSVGDPDAGGKKKK